MVVESQMSGSPSVHQKPLVDINCSMEFFIYLDLYGCRHLNLSKLIANGEGSLL
jgi:hypothetical protein